MTRSFTPSDQYESKLNDVNSTATIIQRMLEQPDDGWETTKQIAASLKRLLGLWAQFLLLRSQWVDLCSDVARDTSYLKDAIEPYPNFIRVGTYGTGWNQGRCASHTVRSEELRPTLPATEDYRSHKQRANEVARAAQWVDSMFSQMLTMHRSRPEYMTIKKRLPLNGRNALSCLLVCDQGRTDRRQPDQHKLFGFSEDASEFYSVLRRQARLVDPRSIERKGRAPSFRAGSELEAELPFNSRKRFNRDYTLVQRLNTYSANCERNTTLGNGTYGMLTGSPTLAKLSKQGYKYANRFAARLGFDAYSSVTTVILSRPERINGGDYEAQAAWHETGRDRWGRADHSKRRVVQGWVYFRQGWNDCYHSEERLDTAAAIAQLDQSSQYFFAWQRDKAEIRLSTRQRQARTLRRLRAIPNVATKDSYTVGNCQIGTSQFKRSLGIDTDLITGRKLAVQWRKSAYRDFGRFEPVLTAAEKRAKQTASEFYRWACEN